jgi:transcriptional regulator with XRE-family HTH domain
MSHIVCSDCKASNGRAARAKGKSRASGRVIEWDCTARAPVRRVARAPIGDPYPIARAVEHPRRPQCRICPMPSDIEKQSFSRRLRAALDQATKVRGATDLAREFNLQHREGEGVSVQSAHKWLSGKAIPTSDKLGTLARWLNVSEHWLHYGPPPDTGTTSTPANRSGMDAHRFGEFASLARKIEALSPRHRLLVEELVAQFYSSMTE